MRAGATIKLPSSYRQHRSYLGAPPMQKEDGRQGRPSHGAGRVNEELLICPAHTLTESPSQPGRAPQLRRCHQDHLVLGCGAPRSVRELGADTRNGQTCTRETEQDVKFRKHSTQKTLKGAKHGHRNRSHAVPVNVEVLGSGARSCLASTHRKLDQLKSLPILEKKTRCTK